MHVVLVLLAAALAATALQIPVDSAEALVQAVQQWGTTGQDDVEVQLTSNISLKASSWQPAPDDQASGHELRLAGLPGLWLDTDSVSVGLLPTLASNAHVFLSNVAVLNPCIEHLQLPGRGLSANTALQLAFIRE